MTVKPGYGIEDLHLGMETNALMMKFGKPERRRKVSSLREYYLYPQLGFECIVSRKTGRILSIFFRRGLQIAELEELRWPVETVNRLYEEPSLQGGGLAIGEDYFDRWQSYDSGVGFYFAQDGRVRTVAIFSAKRRSRIKRAVSHQSLPSHNVAAMRA